jgi:hypothetical protein
MDNGRAAQLAPRGYKRATVVRPSQRKNNNAAVSISHRPVSFDNNEIVFDKKRLGKSIPLASRRIEDKRLPSCCTQPV